MGKEKSEVLETIFKKYPICKKGKVQKFKTKALLGLLKVKNIKCDKCNAYFWERGEKDGEKVYELYLGKSKEKSKYENQELKFNEWKRGISDLDFYVKQNRLPEIQIEDLIVVLQPNEITPHGSNSKLMEERAVRHTYGGAMRVAKGVYIGGRRGESHGELREIDSGTLLLTNKRLVFNGGFRNIEYKLSKIVSVQEHKDGFEIGSSNRKKVQIYMVDEPHKWTEYIKIAIKKSHK